MAGFNHLLKAIENGALLMAVPHCLHGTEFSREEFQYNLLLRYIIVLLNLLIDCYGCGKRF